MAQDSNKKYNPLLLSAILIFGAISAYTTKVGFAMIWGSDSLLTQDLIAWGVALGLGILMVYMSLELTKQLSSASFWGIVCGYVLVASISLFFNFNAILGRQARTANLSNDIELLERGIIGIKAEGDRQLREHFSVIQLTKSVDSLKNEMDLEESHNTRPGRGPRHQRLREEHAAALTALNVASNRVREVERKADSLYTISLGILSDTNLEGSSDEVERRIDTVEQYYLSMYGLYSSEIGALDYPNTISLESKTSGRMENTLYSIFKTVMSSFSRESDISGEERARVYFSLLLGVAIDFPIFFILVFTNITKRRSSNNGRIDAGPLFDKKTKKRKSNIRTADLWRK